MFGSADTLAPFRVHVFDEPSDLDKALGIMKQCKKAKYGMIW
mgnify:CR=1 FL=1